MQKAAVKVMVDIAIRHVDELTDKFRSLWFEDKYKFWNFTNYYEDWKPAENSWNNHEFVVLNSCKEIIGFVGYEINRPNEYVTGLNIVNFSDDKALFGIEAMRIIRDIFDKYHFRKLCFAVVIGNPIEKQYNKLVEDFGGCVVGIRKKHIRLVDGLYYDVKEYEVLLEDYLRRTC